ncbi:hypothetical protein AB3464_25095 [Pseudomonas asplenii]|uniref:hypothetical protein n=1 Tax=Pseudomonas asplenii TaxID=53407 RepID=UPI0037C9A5DC
MAYPRSSRQYAQLVIDEPFDDGKRELMEKCPVEWRATVGLIVESHERRVTEHVRQKEKLRPKQYTASPVIGTYADVAVVRGNPVVAAHSIASIRSLLNQSKEA